MSLRWRPPRVSDLEQCVAISAEPLDTVGISAPIVVERLKGLLLSERIFGAVIFDPDDPSQVMGFGFASAISSPAISSLLSPLSQSLLVSILDPEWASQMLSTHRQIELAHRGSGVNLVGCLNGWKTDAVEIKDALAKSIGTYLSGLYVSSYYKETLVREVGESYSRYLGLPEIVCRSVLCTDGTARESKVFGLTRDEWQVQSHPGQPVNSIFGTKRPVLALRRSWRSVLQVALEDQTLTNLEIASEVGLGRVDSVTKVFESVAKVLETSSISIRRNASEAGNKRRVLDFCKDNLQEIRPWVMLPAQKS